MVPGGGDPPNPDPDPNPNPNPDPDPDPNQAAAALPNARFACEDASRLERMLAGGEVGGAASPKEGVAVAPTSQAELGISQPELGISQPELGISQAELGISQPELGEVDVVSRRGLLGPSARFDLGTAGTLLTGVKPGKSISTMSLGGFLDAVDRDHTSHSISATFTYDGGHFS